MIVILLKKGTIYIIMTTFRYLLYGTIRNREFLNVFDRKSFIQKNRIFFTVQGNYSNILKNSAEKNGGFLRIQRIVQNVEIFCKNMQ